MGRCNEVNSSNILHIALPPNSSSLSKPTLFRIMVVNHQTGLSIKHFLKISTAQKFDWSRILRVITDVEVRRYNYLKLYGEEINTKHDTASLVSDHGHTQIIHLPAQSGGEFIGFPWSCLWLIATLWSIVWAGPTWTIHLLLTGTLSLISSTEGRRKIQRPHSVCRPSRLESLVKFLMFCNNLRLWRVSSVELITVYVGRDQKRGRNSLA